LDIKEATHVLNRLDGKLEAVVRNTANLDSNVVELKVKISNIDAKLVATDNRINELKLEAKAKQVEENPFAVMWQKQKSEILLRKTLLLKQRKELEELQAKYDATIYWVSGFKRVRLFVIEETLRQLEVEVNNSLTSLGLVDWSIEFDVERENKSGGVTKGFVVFIRCPSNPEPVRWESWSGGETQRLQLAGDFGLANLIMMQAGLTNTIEFYDEPSNHLSDEGVNDLAETLHQRALDDGKTIWLVDHRMPEFGDFKAKLEVVKTETGSTWGDQIDPVVGELEAVT
jgi:DNA repair exonuclease SbcCD ATPase subunit